MKRVIIFDLDAATMDDVNALQEVLKKKKAQLEKKEQEEQEEVDEKEYYDTFIRKAVKIYQENDKLFDEDEDEYVALKCALRVAYEKEGHDVWKEFDPELEFGDSPPCMVDDGWCSGNLDRIGELTFYHNRFNDDWIICHVCLDNSRDPDFDEVFVAVDDGIDDMKKELKK